MDPGAPSMSPASVRTCAPAIPTTAIDAVKAINNSPDQRPHPLRIVPPTSFRLILPRGAPGDSVRRAHGRPFTGGITDADPARLTFGAGPSSKRKTEGVVRDRRRDGDGRGRLGGPKVVRGAFRRSAGPPSVARMPRCPVCPTKFSGLLCRAPPAAAHGSRHRGELRYGRSRTHLP